MRFSHFCRSRASFVSAACGLFVYATAVPATAQSASAAPLGVPQDWSHRHVIHSNPDTLEEAAAKGTLDQWMKKADDPRFVLQLEKKLAKLQAPAGAEDDEPVINGRGARKSALAASSGSGKGKNKKVPPTPLGQALHRDWSNVMGGARGVGNTRTYPAKFAFGTTAKNCTSDFVVFTTSTAGAASTGSFNSRPGTFTGIPVAGEAVSITNVPYNQNQVLTLTADASVNTGLKFFVGASAPDSATNLANAIARNGGTVGVTATVAGAVVTVTSVTAGVANGDLTYAETLSNFTWGTQTAGAAVTTGQPTIFALNQLYADTVANGGCQTPTQAVPAVYWSYNTATPSATFAGATGTDAIISTTPVYGPLSGKPCAAFVASTNPGACDTTVGVATVVQNFAAQLQFNIPAATTFRLTVYKNGVATALTCDITTGKTCSDTTHSLSLKVGDKVAVQVVKLSGTDQPNRASLFSVTVPLAGPFIAALSPTLSLDGSQVAFIQTDANNISSLLLLKWSDTAPGTLGAPTTPTPVAPSDYRSCDAPCMTTLPLTGGANNTNSSPYVDYTGDELYVGDDTGKLHRFSGVFRGTPARAGAPWPVQVAATNSIMSSPVFDGGSTVYIGSNGPNAVTGNKLHRVDTATGTFTSSGAIGSSSAANGVRDAPILDTSSGKVYAFQGAFTTAGQDALGTTCNGGTCNTVFQFAANFVGGDTGSFVFVGDSGNQNDLNRAMNSGAFDDAYYSSDGQTGNLYVCGSRPTVERRANLWKISIAGGNFSAKTQGPLLVSGDSNDGCSPPTVFKNGTERLYVSVNNNAAAIGGGGCTQTFGCMYMYTLAPSFVLAFDTTSLSSTTDATNRFLSVSTPAVLNANEGSVDTSLTSANAGTYIAMTITQSVAPPLGTTNTFTLRKNGASTPITCQIAGGLTCTDSSHAVGTLPGDAIDVLVTRTGSNTTATFRVQLMADVTWNEQTPASSALNATGGSGGIIIDNAVPAPGGGSQVYFSTRGAGNTPLGIAVQASQAGLQ